MQGSIRFILGLLIAWIAAGSMDTATDSQLIPLIAVAVLGLVSMYSGARALKDSQ
jgi:hypothetical protein